jgi:hypothetical protein
VFTISGIIKITIAKVRKAAFVVNVSPNIATKIPTRDGHGIKRNADAYLPKRTSNIGKTPNMNAIGNANKTA